MIIEVIGGLWTNSIGVLTDACETMLEAVVVSF